MIAVSGSGAYIGVFPFVFELAESISAVVTT